jgi:Uma2 family endonuclease
MGARESRRHRESVMSTVSQPYVTPEEYLARERRAESRSEYVDGRIYAMTGASEPHNLIALNVASELRARFRGRPCRVYASDMRVKVGETGMYTYPDVVAVCGQPRFEDAHVDTLLDPTVIVEVLSPSTERYDRGEEFAHYRRLASLQEHVLVAQDRVRVEHFARRGEQWLLTEFSDLDGAHALPSLDCTLPLRDVYERVAPFAADPPDPRG